MAPPISLGIVEVRKDAESQTWYSGHVAEMVSDDVLRIAFEGDVWPQQDFSLSAVRKPPKMSSTEVEKFNPCVGDEVELHVNASEHAPPGWGLAIVRNIKHGFYFVARMSSTVADGNTEAIVEKDMLRPVTGGGSLSSAALRQEIYKLPADLVSWVSTPDAIGCFTHIEEQSGLIFLQSQRQGLRLVGEPKAIQRATMLLEMHVEHQGKIQRFQDMREKRLQALEKKRNRIEGTGFKHSADVHVDAQYIGRIIGNKGEAIRALQEKYDVSIRIADDDKDEEERVVRIFGNSVEKIEKAKAEVEFVDEVLAVEPQMFSWILGRGGRTIQNFRESSGLVKCSLDRESQVLRMSGTRYAVQDAVAMFETHIMYFPVFHQMDEEMEQILAQLEEYGDYNARWDVPWGWYRDEEDDGKASVGKGGKDGANGKKGGKGGSKGKTDSKTKGKSKGWGEEKEQAAVRPPRAKDGKGQKGRWYNASEEEDEEEDEEDEDDDEEEDGEEDDEAGPKGTSRGARGFGRAASRGRGRAPRRTSGAIGEVRPVPGARKMGKKGMRY